MRKLLRALFLSAAGATLAALAARAISGAGPSLPVRSRTDRDAGIDADELAPEQRDLLLKELDAQL